VNLGKGGHGVQEQETDRSDDPDGFTIQISEYIRSLPCIEPTTVPS
jgi:hypothetical protein